MVDVYLVAFLFVFLSPSGQNWIDAALSRSAALQVKELHKLNLC